MRSIRHLGLMLALAALSAAIGQSDLRAQPRWPQSETDPFYKAMTFRAAKHGLTGDCSVDGHAVPAIDIYVVGEFDPPVAGQPGPVERFRAFLRANPTVPHCTTVFFHSPGGHLDAALEFGAIIRAHKLNTSIGLHYTGAADLVRRANERAICFSACTFAFLGGVRRSAGSGYYGVHRFARGKPADEQRDKSLPRNWKTDAYYQERAQKTVANLLKYVADMDASPDLLREMARAKQVTQVGDVPEPAANFLGAATMARLRITTPLATGEWAIVNDRGAAAVRATVRDRDRQHALLLTCERAGAAPRVTVTLFLQTAEPDLFLATRRLTVWRRQIGGPIKDGFRIMERNDLGLGGIVRAEQSPRRALAGQKPGVMASLPIAELPFDLRRQTEIYFGFVARIERTVQSPAGPRRVTDDQEAGFQLDMTGGTQKIAELVETCR